AEWTNRQLPVQRDRDRMLAVLQEAGLTEPNGGGWLIHDYLDYNPSAEQAEHKRAADAARKREVRRE
ncbi:MAG: hypothetical protein ACREMB_13730, partial [Candidatus Rokuibacteriota bacterium]